MMFESPNKPRVESILAELGEGGSGEMLEKLRVLFARLQQDYNN